MTNIEEIRKIKETLSTPGWQILDKIFKSTLDDHISVTKYEHKDMAKLMYSQAIIQVIEGLYNELELIDRREKDEINLFKKYKKGV